MATFGTDGFAELSLSLTEIAEMPEHVLDEMLEAGADVLVDGLQQSARTMLQGKYYKDGVAQSVKKGRKIRTPEGKAIMINFVGTQHGERLARIAYINEYGKKNQHARPFIRTAVEKTAEAVTEAQARIYDNYLKSKNL